MIKVSENVKVSSEPVMLENWKGYAVKTIICGIEEENIFKGKHGRRDAQRFIGHIQFIHTEERTEEQG